MSDKKGYVLDEDSIMARYCVDCMLQLGGLSPRQRNDCFECYGSLKKGMERVDITQRYKRMKGY